MWDNAAAMALCVALEAIAPTYGAHVALTGGCLYKTGTRKDCDILFYRIRQVEEIDVTGLLAAARDGCGVEIVKDAGWCVKARHLGRGVDFFFPERPGAEQLHNST